MGDFADYALDECLDDAWPELDQRSSHNDFFPEKRTQNMVIVSRVAKVNGPTKKLGIHRPTDDVSLPTKLNEPPTAFSDYVTCLFGEKGIGKTSLASQFDSPLTAQWEPGRRHLKILQVPQKGEQPLNWARYKRYQELAIEDGRIKTIVNDTIDRAYQACFNWVCEQKGVPHPSKANDYGQTWKDIFEEFENVLNRIHVAGKTPLYLSHGKYKEVEDAISRTTTEKFIPTCADKAMEHIDAVCDFVFCLIKRETERVIVVRGTSTLFASCGVPDTFLCPDTGKELAEIPMGGSPQEAYRNLCLAFENKLPGRILEAPHVAEEQQEESKPKKKKVLIRKK